MLLMGHSNLFTDLDMSNYLLSNRTTTSGIVGFVIPLQSTRGGKKLYVSGTRVLVRDADTSNYIDRIRLFGVTHNSDTTIDDLNPADYKTVGIKDDTFTAVDCSGYVLVICYIDITVATANNLEFYPLIRFYYDD